MYTATRSFTAKNGQHYSLEQTISNSEFYDLHPEDRDGFQGDEEDDEELEKHNNPGINFLSDNLDVTLEAELGSLLDNNDTTSSVETESSNDSFGGYNGGDFGGGGAQSDY